jgi:hypothetical protein
MHDPQREIRSFAIKVLRSPAYLRALEQRLLAGEAPELDLYRYWRDHGPLSKQALEGIRWHRGLKCWVGQVYVNDVLVYRGQHRLLRDAVKALEAAVERTSHIH